MRSVASELRPLVQWCLIAALALPARQTRATMTASQVLFLLLLPLSMASASNLLMYRLPFSLLGLRKGSQGHVSVLLRSCVVLGKLNNLSDS